MPGTGTVVTGTVLSGAVARRRSASSSVRPGSTARVRSIHAQNRPAERGAAGQTAARSISPATASAKDAIARGDVVLDPALHAPTDRIDATLRVLATEAKAGRRNGCRCGCIMRPPKSGRASCCCGDEPIPPGGEGLVQLVLEQPIAAAVGDRFVLRDTTAQRTIGGGTFLDLRAPRAQAPHAGAAGAARGACASPTRERALAALARRDRLSSISPLSRATARSAAETSRRSAERSRCSFTLADGTPSWHAVTPEWLHFEARSVGAAGDVSMPTIPICPGIGLRAACACSLQPRLPAPFSAFLQGLATSGEIALDGAWVRLPSHAVRLTPADERLWAQIAPLLGGDERFRPPRVRDIAGDARRSRERRAPAAEAARPHGEGR